MTPKSKHFYEFGGFRLDADEEILYHSNEPVPLTPKAVQTLLVLVRKNGHLVSKDELFETVWTNTFVEENTLSFNISSLRKTLAKFDKSATYIQTVPRKGFRFAAEVRETFDGGDEIVLERHAVSRTLIEEIPAGIESEKSLPAAAPQKSEFPFWKVFAAIVLAAAAIAAAVYFRRSAERTEMGEKPSAAKIKSIAVLPLKSFSAGSDDEELRLRVTDALITGLGDLRQVSVRPTSSVLRFTGENLDAIEIGKKLAVDAVLDGRMQKEADRVRVTLQLVSVAGGEQLLSEQFDGKADELLKLQDQISARLFQKINFSDSADRQSAARQKRPTESNEAYEAYLKGRFYWNQRTSESLQKSIGFFESAIERDKGFALAHAGLADVYCVLPEYSNFPEMKAYAEAERRAVRALELDKNLAEAHASLAFVEYWARRDAAKSELAFRRSIELNPNYATARHWYANVLLAEKRLTEAEAEMRQAQRLDPLSNIINTELGILLYYERKLGEAEAQFREALELNPAASRTRNWLGRALTVQGKYAEALGEFERSLGSEPQRESVYSEIALALARQGRRAEAEKYLAKSLALAPNTMISFNIALIYAGLDEKEKAAEWLQKAERERRSDLAFIELDPVFDSLRSLPEFDRLVNRSR